MISSFKVRLSRCCGDIRCPLVPGEEGILGRRIPWAGGVVTGAGKKLELGLRKKYFGTERDFPGSSEMGEPKGGGQGENAQEGGVGRESEGCPGMTAGGGKDGPGWLHQRVQNGPGDEQLQFGDEFKVFFLEEWKIVLGKK